MNKGVTVRESVDRPIEYKVVFYSDEKILDLFPDDGDSLVNPLLRRAQKAEAKIERLWDEKADIGVALWRAVRQLPRGDFRDKLYDFVSRKCPPSMLCEAAKAKEVSDAMRKT